MIFFLVGMLKIGLLYLKYVIILAFQCCLTKFTNIVTILSILSDLKATELETDYKMRKWRN